MVPLFSFEGFTPVVSPTAWIAPTRPPSSVTSARKKKPGAKFLAEADPAAHRELATRHAGSVRPLP